MSVSELRSWDDSVSEKSACPSVSEIQSTCASLQEVSRARRPIREKTHASFMKTEFCRYYKNGKCTKGDGCSFAHGESELRARPDLTNTILCRFWSTNRCNKGASCLFAHGKDELIKKHDAVHPVSGQTKTPARQGKPGRPAAKNLLTVAANGRSDVAPSARTGPQGGTPCPQCLFPRVFAGARFCTKCGGALIAPTVLDQESTQPGPYDIQCEPNPIIPAEQEAVQVTHHCPLYALCSMTQVSSAAAVPPTSSWHGTSPWPQTSSPSGLILMPMLVNIAGTSGISLKPEGPVLHAQGPGVAGAESMDGLGGTQWPCNAKPAGLDHYALSQTLSIVAQQQVYED